MSERDGYEHGVPCWVATIQADPDEAADFYAGLFGWEYDDGDGFRIARLRGRVVTAVAPLPPGVDPPPPSDWITSVHVDSADGAAERAREAGGRVVAEPFQGPMGRMAVITDPGGATLSVFEPEWLKGCEVVNEPGAWAMSRLDTPDPDAAKAFYGAVFGWTSETFEMGDLRATLFRLPGFVGGEPEQPVSREVVATMARSSGDARWMVDFWVEDVDAAAAKAQELGGSVAAPPMDLPIGQTAVLADPAGVTFSVSRVTARA
jgi:uncharacterized protein